MRAEKEGICILNVDMISYSTYTYVGELPYVVPSVLQLSVRWFKELQVMYGHNPAIVESSK